MKSKSYTFGVDVIQIAYVDNHIETKTITYIKYTLFFLSFEYYTNIKSKLQTNFVVYCANGACIELFLRIKRKQMWFNIGLV